MASASGSEWLGPEGVWLGPGPAADFNRGFNLGLELDFDEVQNFVALATWKRWAIAAFQYLGNRHRLSFRAWKRHAGRAVQISQSFALQEAKRRYWYRRTGVEAILKIQYQ